MATINSTIQPSTVSTNTTVCLHSRPIELALPSSSIPSFSPLNEAFAVLREVKHSLFQSLYSFAGSSSAVRPGVEFLDHEILTKSFATQTGLAIAAGIPSGFVGRAAGDLVLAFFFRNNSIAKVCALPFRMLTTHWTNKFLSHNLPRVLQGASWQKVGLDENDFLPLLNIGFSEVLGHSMQKLSGGGISGFILGRIIGGGANCLASGLEILVGQGINKIARHFLHHNLFDQVEQREVHRDAFNLKEWVKNSIIDAAFCGGHGVFGLGAHILRRVESTCPTANGNGRTHEFAFTVESPSRQDFVKFAHQSPLALRHAIMLTTGAMGGGNNSGRPAIEELRSRYANKPEALARLEILAKRDTGKNSTEIEIPEGFAEIPSGSFTMGDPVDAGGHANEQSYAQNQLVQANRVIEISRNFYLQKKPVTVGEVREYVNAMKDLEVSLGLFIHLESGHTHFAGFGRAHRKLSDVKPGEPTGGDLVIPEDFSNALHALYEADRAGNSEEFWHQAAMIQDALADHVLVDGIRAFLQVRPELDSFLKVAPIVPQNWEYNHLPTRFNYEDHPAVYVNWYEANAYARWKYGPRARLPTEAEWEYAARGGQQYTYGTSTGQLNPALAHYGQDYNSGSTASVNSSRPANPFGLYDMTGNVWEWTNSWFAFEYYQSMPKRDPMGPLEPDKSSGRVMRGGSWDNSGTCLRAAWRHFYPPGSCHLLIGFRVLLAQD